MNEVGKVYLVGAGPGDEGLLTLKAAKLLERAEVVVYDRLVSRRILSRISPAAKRINAGKNAHNHTIPQHKINQLLLEHALQGKLVVRLKGGDPFLFGRGGEELELLEQNHIPFEVVPGVTSAIAAAAYAGIPVTHRDYCSSLHIITGHAKQGQPLALDYNALAALGGTLVFMMAVSSMPEIALRLIEAGLGAQTPAAMIENGTRSDQRKWVFPLCKIARVLKENQVGTPAVVVVGRVCALSERFDWFSPLPLRGCRVLVTRPAQTAGTLSQLLCEAGAEPIELPCIRTVPIAAFPLDLDGLDWLIFTSAAGVESFFHRLAALGLDSRSLYGKKLAAVGPATAAGLAQHGITADFVPSVFDGAHLGAELLENRLQSGQRAGLYRAKSGSEEIVKILRNGQIQVTDTAVYETLSADPPPISIDRFDYAAFTSASCVQALAKTLGDAVDYSRIKAVCIGEQTASLARQAGMQTLIASACTLASMVEKLKEAVQHAKPTA